MPKKMTAIEYVQRVIYIHLTHEQQMQFEGLFQQAKAMEKEQIMDAYREGRTDQQTRVPKYYNRSSAIYYTSTFKS